ncbi:type IV secretion protein IcmL [Rickettsiella endosymbiont of Rhagonycha lignosa]|uniref:type IV secretion protein IcmL n=1 Tax=Rickettsiella endosymbiont of Rhagonycha lignosa TaxID=3077937 RepID=UPI00313A7A73
MGNRIELLKSRKGFYRHNYNRVCSALLLSLLIILILSALVIYLAIFSATPDFYASSQDGKLTRLVLSNFSNTTRT